MMTKFVRQTDRFRNSFGAALAGFFALTLTAHGGETRTVVLPSRPLNLNDCIALALDESPLLESSRLDVTSAAEEARATRAKYLPEIDAQASYQLFTGSPTTKFSVINTGTAVGVGHNAEQGAVELYSAHLSYPLFRDGSIMGLNVSPAEGERLAKKRNLAWTAKLRREDVIARIADAFISTVSAENRAGYAERRVTLLQKQVDITEEQEKQGLMLPIDLKVARTQLSGAKTLATILRQQAIAGKHELAGSLGFDSPDQLRLSNELPEPPEPPSAEQLLGSAMNQHPSLQAQKALIDQAKEAYRLERFRLYPSVTLDGSAVHIDDFGSNGEELYVGTVNVNVPIFDFGAQMLTTRSKFAAYQAEKARLAAVSDDVTYQIMKIYQSIYILSHNILSLQGEIAKSDRDFQVISSQQQQGISPPLTAIEKELHLIARKDELDGLEVRRLMLYAELQKASGGSWKWLK
jgi:outer membrane protein TolC